MDSSKNQSQQNVAPCTSVLTASSPEFWMHLMWSLTSSLTKMRQLQKNRNVPVKVCCKTGKSPNEVSGRMWLLSSLSLSFFRTILWRSQTHIRMKICKFFYWISSLVLASKIGHNIGPKTRQTMKFPTWGVFIRISRSRSAQLRPMQISLSSKL